MMQQYTTHFVRQTATRSYTQYGFASATEGISWTKIDMAEHKVHVSDLILA
jgi:hypothetical protein